MSIPPTPTSIRSNSTTTSRSSLFRYYIDQHQEHQELVHMRALLAQKESENAALRQAVLEWQSKADTYHDMHQTLRRRMWSLEEELDALKRAHIRRTDHDGALIASLIQKSDVPGEVIGTPVQRHSPIQPLFTDYNGYRRSSIGIDDPCAHAEEAYKTAVSQVALGRKKSESLVLGIHDMVRAIEAELAYLETASTSSEDEDEDDSIIKPSTPPENDVGCLLKIENGIQREHSSSPPPKPMAANIPATLHHPPATMPRPRSQSMVQSSDISSPTTRHNPAAAVLTAETIPQSAAVRMAAALNGTSSRLMLHCQKQQDPRRRKSAFLLGNMSPMIVPQQQQQPRQQHISAVSEQWKISSNKRS